MKSGSTLSLAVLSLALLMFGVRGLAADPKPETLKGTLECSKCALKETADCGNVLVVKEGNSERKYYLVDNELSKSNHKTVCMAPKDNVSVTGTVEEKDGKKWLNATKIDFPAAK